MDPDPAEIAAGAAQEDRPPQGVTVRDAVTPAEAERLVGLRSDRLEELAVGAFAAEADGTIRLERILGIVLACALARQGAMPLGHALAAGAMAARAAEAGERGVLVVGLGPAGELRTAWHRRTPPPGREGGIAVSIGENLADLRALVHGRSR